MPRTRPTKAAAVLGLLPAAPAFPDTPAMVDVGMPSAPTSPGLADEGGTLGWQRSRP